MSGYVSSLFSGTQNQTQYGAYNQPQSPTSAQPNYTSSSTSSWTASLSTGLASLRKGLTAFSSADEKDDPDFEDSSHVSCVLRAYYIEKGRPFPPWLPPDPKKPTPQPEPQQWSSYGRYAGYGASRDGYGQFQQATSAAGGGLRDLFGNSSSTSPTPSQSASQSLRNRPGLNSPPPDHTQPLNSWQPPGQMASNYQQQQQQSGIGAGGGVGSRDRLRARLQGRGSGRNSPVPAISPGEGGSYSGQFSQGGGNDGYGQRANTGNLGGSSDTGYGAGYGGGGGGGGGTYASGPPLARPLAGRQLSGGMGLPSGPRPRPGGPW